MAIISALDRADNIKKRWQMMKSCGGMLLVIIIFFLINSLKRKEVISISSSPFFKSIKCIIVSSKTCSLVEKISKVPYSLL